MTSHVRRLVPDDSYDFVVLRREALEREPFAFLASPEDDRALDPAFVREALTKPAQATCGAFDPDLAGIVGIAHQSLLKKSHVAIVWGTYVTPARRGRGLGRALMEEALRFARELPGVSQVNLGVAETGVPALRLYEKLGFVRWGTEPNALRVGDRTIAEHHMVLVLDGLAHPSER